MAAPTDSSTTAAATAGHDEAAAVKTRKPLPRAIQLAMTISSGSEPSTATSTSTKTIGEHADGADRFLMWYMLVMAPSMFIALAALSTSGILDDDDDDEVISGAGGFVFLAVQVLPPVYLAVVPAAWGQLGLFAPRTPYAAWDALFEVGFKGMGPPVILTSLGASVLYALMPDQAWLLLVTCACLFGLLVASTIAFWVCLLRTYGGGERREKNNSSGTGSEAIIDGLAYLYSRLLCEYAVRFLADADAGVLVEQLDTDSSV